VTPATSFARGVPAGYERAVLDEALVPLPEKGRVFRHERTVRFADADAEGRLRLDGVARYLQDLGNDDTADAGEEASSLWVVRRAVVDVVASPRWRDPVRLATWCGGTGSRWAERRMSLVGDDGARIEVATLWIHVDATTMAPARIPDGFVATYGEAAGGRKVSSRRWLDGVDDGAASVAWPLRASDIDLIGHVNNAAYWEAVEEQLLGGRASVRPGAGRHPLLAAPFRAVLEYGAGIAPDADVTLRVADAPDRLSVWFTAAGATLAAATVFPQPGTPQDRL
jgi:acyl-ACP thioesterase